MKTDIKKTSRAITWLTEHTLSAEQRQQLIAEKIERARLLHQALKQREGRIKTR
jgi:hypothetical protein